jgi:hypothetical protein
MSRSHHQRRLKFSHKFFPWLSIRTKTHHIMAGALVGLGWDGTASKSDFINGFLVRETS